MGKPLHQHVEGRVRLKYIAREIDKPNEQGCRRDGVHELASDVRCKPLLKVAGERLGLEGTCVSRICSRALAATPIALRMREISGSRISRRMKDWRQAGLAGTPQARSIATVSYTHLTLPTKA